MYSLLASSATSVVVVAAAAAAAAATCLDVRAPLVVPGSQLWAHILSSNP
jgi:hypothetical protein